MRGRSFAPPLLISITLATGAAFADDAPPAPRALPGPAPISPHSGDVRSTAHGAPRALPGPAPISGVPWLGISMDDGGDIGVRVAQVVRNSPAERGGIRAGDRIVAIDGVRVAAPAQVSRGVAIHKVGDTVTVSLERMGTPFTAAIVLGARPASDELVRMHLVGAPAPAWVNVTAPSGAPSSVASLKGKVALIDFWASWCGPCRLVAPRLNALKDRLGPQGLAVIGITTDDAEVAAVFAEKHRMRYPSVIDNDGETSRAYGISGLPTMVLIDRRGIVRDVFVGFDPNGDARLEAAIKKLLAEPAPPLTPLAPSVVRPEGRG
jgi:peroxiredoxin